MCSGSVGTAPGLTRDERIATLIEAQTRLQRQVNVVQTDLNQGYEKLLQAREKLDNERDWETRQQVKLAKLKGEKAAIERQLKEVL